MQDMIRLIQAGGKLKNLKMWWMKSHSNLLKAFSRLIFRAIRPFLLLKVVME